MVAKVKTPKPAPKKPPKPPKPPKVPKTPKPPPQPTTVHDHDVKGSRVRVDRRNEPLAPLPEKRGGFFSRFRGRREHLYRPVSQFDDVPAAAAAVVPDHDDHDNAKAAGSGSTPAGYRRPPDQDYYDVKGQASAAAAPAVEGEEVVIRLHVSDFRYPVFITSAAIAMFVGAALTAPIFSFVLVVGHFFTGVGRFFSGSIF